MRQERQKRLFCPARQTEDVQTEYIRDAAISMSHCPDQTNLVNTRARHAGKRPSGRTQAERGLQENPADYCAKAQNPGHNCAPQSSAAPDLYGPPLLSP